MGHAVIPFPRGTHHSSVDEAKGRHLSALEKQNQALEIRCAELESTIRKLGRLAYVDELTGLANRRCFDRALEEEIRRSSRTKLPLTLIMCDVDHFKWYNDAYGHQCGDTVLRRLGRLLNTSFRRAGDVVARYGGEEFALLLPGTSSTPSLHLAERLRLAVENLKLANGSTECPRTLSVSLGVTTHHPISRCTPDDIVDAADVALYQAKHDGRNCVCYQPTS